MGRFPAGVSGNPGGRPLAARGLRALLEARYGRDGEGLIEELHHLTRSRNHRVRLEALRLLSHYFFGPPTTSVTVDVTNTTATAWTPVMLALLSDEELRFLSALNGRLALAQGGPSHLMPPAVRDDTEPVTAPLGTCGRELMEGR